MRTDARHHGTAFTLLEVLVASAIFFIAIFSILRITTQQLNAARSLQNLEVDTGILPSLISLTNRLDEGPLPPEIRDAFHQMANDTEGGGESRWSCDGFVTLQATNGLYRVDYVLRKRLVSGSVREFSNSLLLWRP